MLSRALFFDHSHLSRSSFFSGVVNTQLASGRSMLVHGLAAWRASGFNLAGLKAFQVHSDMLLLIDQGMVDPRHSMSKISEDW